jgi:hypothetical protein
MAADISGTEVPPSAAGAGANGADPGDARRPDTPAAHGPAIVADWRRAVEARCAPFVMVAEAHAALRGIEPKDPELADGANVYYDGLYGAFVQSNGRLVQLHWPQHMRGGLALTAHSPKRQRFSARLRAKRGDTRGTGSGPAADARRVDEGAEQRNADRDLYDLHAVYDYRGPAELLNYASQLDTMMIDTRLFLRGALQRSAADTVYSCYADVLGSLDDAMRSDSPQAATDSAAPPARAKPSGPPRWPSLKQCVTDARALVDELGQRQAEGHYLIGAVSGLMLTLAVALPLSITLRAVGFAGGLSLQALLGSMIAGASAAILSVLLRTGRGNLHVRWRVGRSMTFLLGTFRPLVGAISGGIAYLLLQTQLIGGLSGKSDAFYWAVGVLAGFSERFVPDMLTRSEDALQPGAHKPQQGSSDASAPQPS